MIETNYSTNAWPAPHRSLVERVKVFRFAERKECLHTTLYRSAGNQAAGAPV